MTSREVLEKALEAGYVINSARQKNILSSSGEQLKRYAIKYGVLDNRSPEERRFQNAVSCYRGLASKLSEMAREYETHDLGQALTGEYVEPEIHKRDMARVRVKIALIKGYLDRHGEEDGGFANADLMWRWVRG